MDFCNAFQNVKPRGERQAKIRERDEAKREEKMPDPIVSTGS